MFDSLLDSFADEFTKIANRAVMDALVKAHIFHDDSAKNWNGFERDLKSKNFQTAMLLHEKTKEDPKLKKYVKNFGGYLTSKDVVGKVPSRTKNKQYTIKRLPSGRLACGCKDWQYVHSHKGTNCDHIQLFKSMEKQSAPIPMAFWRGMGGMHKATAYERRKLKAAH